MKETKTTKVRFSKDIQIIHFVDQDSSVEDEVFELKMMTLSFFIDDIIWDEQAECYIHVANDIRYDPVTNSFYKWISQEKHDFWVLVYTPVEGSLKLLDSGEIWQNNSTLLSEDDWDKSYLYLENFEGYHLDLSDSL